MARPEFSKIEKLLKSGEEFSLNEREYQKKTGCPLPKNKYYLEKDSALSRKAADYGYEIKVIERRVLLKKRE